MRWRQFFIAWGWIIFLVGSFCIPWTKVYWDILDRGVFKLLNSSLEKSYLLQLFWACANHKWMDLVDDGIFLLLFILGVKEAPKFLRWRRGAQFLFAILLAGSVIFFVNRHLLRAYVIFPRESPSLAITPCVRISEEVPWIPNKDETLLSFPGDHATTLLLFGFLYASFVSRRLAIPAWAYAGFRLLPRLVVGAHWFSDIAVGSVSLALFFLACFVYTPLSKFIIELLERFLGEIFGETFADRARRRDHESG